jgi:hypothetical protein
MKLAMLAGLILLVSTAGFAEKSWSGYLVDSACYESLLKNTKGSTTVDRNMIRDTKRCTPSAKTKSFGLVEQDWKMFKFDPEGNAKASEFVNSAAKQDMYRVSVAADMDRDVLKVDSISLAQ